MKGPSRANAHGAWVDPTHRRKTPAYAAQDSPWRCPHCGAGVKPNVKGLAPSHALGGGKVTSKRVPCLGAGQPAVERDSVTEGGQ